MEKLEIELVTLSKLYPSDSVFGLEVRKIANRIRMENINKEKISMESLKKSIDENRSTI
jgi:hypothetical protein